MTDWEGVLLNSTALPGEGLSARVGQLTVPPVPIQPVRWGTICGKLEEDTVQKIWVLNSKPLVRINENLPNTHGKGVDVFVQLVQQGDGLDDHVVRPVDVEFDFGSGVAVTQAKLGLGGSQASQALHQGVEVQTDA